jgi:uncharacterized Zn-binding protein involved in type VI secretion
MPGAAFVGCQTLCWEEVEDENGNKTCLSMMNTISSGSPNVMVNGAPAAMVGSATTHPCNVVSGSATVLVNGVGFARLGDLLSCQCQNSQGNIATGSTNVLVG